MTKYSKASHTVFYHRHHLVWITKYRYPVLKGAVRLRARAIISQAAEDLGVRIINGALANDHVHILAEIPPHVSVSDFVKTAKGRSSRKIQQEFPDVRKRYWGQRFWGRGFFSTTSGNVTDDVISDYIKAHTDAHKRPGEDNIALEK